MGTTAFQHGSEEVRELLELSKDAPGFAKPLRQFLETMDDRDRAIESDARAKASAPPEPDPTAIPDDANFRGLAPQGGFTGLEGVWDYVYWQTLSINMLDDVGHIVRLGLTVTPDCSELHNQPPQNAEEEAVFKKCNQWIGAHQPGVNECDFSIADCGDQADQQSGLGSPDNPNPPSKRNRGVETRGPGELEAPPIPGKPDPSLPHVNLPPLVKELIEKLAPEKLTPEKVPDNLKDKLPELPQLSDPQPSPETLLDFLLTP